MPAAVGGAVGWGPSCRVRPASWCFPGTGGPLQWPPLSWAHGSPHPKAGTPEGTRASLLETLVSAMAITRGAGGDRNPAYVD